MRRRRLSQASGSFERNGCASSCHSRETAKTGEARLLDRSGKPIGVTVGVSERADAGIRWLVADLNPAPLGAGDYVVELSADRDGRRDVIVTAIRIVQ